ncbi:MAG: GCN5-related N-acetyltransferase [Bacillales bacterium]|jgi:predicted acetyltransferase|nr:GCN5-related N-acetyltransferase [Bacillales bacterium]
MDKVQLILPSEEYLHSYLEACQEMRDSDVKTFSIHDPAQYDEWKNSIFQTYKDRREGINLKPDYVPDTTFWLVENNEFIGLGSVRHYLTPALQSYGGHIGYMIRPSKWNSGFGSLQLKLLLKEAAKLGIKEALLTCAVSNPASAKVMENNGGVRIDTTEVFAEGELRHIHKYLIPTSN